MSILERMTWGALSLFFSAWCEGALFFPQAQLVDLGLRSESLELSVHLQQLEQRSLADAYESLRVLTQCGPAH